MKFHVINILKKLLKRLWSDLVKLNADPILALLKIGGQVQCKKNFCPGG